MSEAVENQLLSDATGRNALYKIHVSLGKIVNNLDAAVAAGPRVSRRSMSAAVEERVGGERTVVPEAEIKEEEEEVEESVVGGDDVEETIVEEVEESGMEESVVDGTVVHLEADSIVDELLDDDGDTVMG